MTQGVMQTLAPCKIDSDFDRLVSAKIIGIIDAKCLVHWWRFKPSREEQ